MPPGSVRKRRNSGSLARPNRAMSTPVSAPHKVASSAIMMISSSSWRWALPVRGSSSSAKQARNRDLADQRLSQMDSSLGSLDDLGNRLKVLLIQRLNDASAVPGTLSAEAEQLLDQTVADLNVDLAGQHLFSG